VHHSINGSFSIRQGHWKLELCPDSGGWSDPRPGNPNAKGKKKAVPAAALPPVQLYDLSTDIGETKNLQAEHPEIVERLSKLLEKYVAEGRSTPAQRRKIRSMRTSGSSRSADDSCHQGNKKGRG